MVLTKQNNSPKRAHKWKRLKQPLSDPRLKQQGAINMEFNVGLDSITNHKEVKKMTCTEADAAYPGP